MVINRGNNIWVVMLLYNYSHFTKIIIIRDRKLLFFTFFSIVPTPFKMIPLRKRTKTILCPGHCQKIHSCLPCLNMMITDWSTCTCRWTSPSPNLHYWWRVTFLIWVNIDARIGTKLCPYFVRNQWKLIIICSQRLDFFSILYITYIQTLILILFKTYF